MSSYMNMFKKDFKGNFVSFLIWTAVFVGFVFMYVPMTDQLTGQMSEMVKLVEKLPDVFLKMFNFDVDIISKPEGIFGSEAMSFIYFLSAIFSATLASSIFSKEFENKTIEYLLVKPLKRRTVFWSKSAVLLTFIVIEGGVFTFFILSAFKMFVLEPYSTKILYSFGLYTLADMTFFAGLSTLVSIASKKSSLNTSFSIGITVFMYFGDSLGRSFENIKWLTKVSIFHYIPLADTIRNNTIYAMNSLIIILIGLGLMIIAYYLFEGVDITT